MGHGYVILEPTGSGPWPGGAGQIRGHEFHHSRVVNLGEADFAYKIIRGQGVDGSHDGLLYRNVLAAYGHLHAAGAPEWAKRFVSFVREIGFRSRKEG
jgi:cobyrinic acid a,c-diamide synthase